MKKHKICIIGGGLSGLMSALIINDPEIDIDLIANFKKSNTRDFRATAISESNYIFLKQNINKLDKTIFSPVKKINLFYEKGKIINNFLNFDEGKNLMFLFENNELKSHLLRLIKKIKFNIIKSEVETINISNNEVVFRKGNIRKKNYDLIILCLGSNSKLYSKVVGNREITKNYNEYSITGSVSHRLKNLSSRQYFLNEGPLAILPFKKNLFSFVWSIDSKYYDINNKNILIILKKRLKKILNTTKLKFNKISSYPLKLSIKKNYYKNNTLILGDGLHTVHPIAGQGFNLVLRDIKVLQKLIKFNLSLGLTLKDSSILNEFSANRKPENIFLGLGIDLTRTFFKKNKYFDPIKGIILDNFEDNQILKKFSKVVSNKGLTF